ncbi:MAG: hypothetical protein AAGJ37_17080 [Pseudomonadota bacterium]
MKKPLFFFTVVLSVFTASSLAEYAIIETASVRMDSSLFLPFQALPLLKDDEIDEASGIAASRYHKDAFWVHNDSGDKPRLFLVNKYGHTLAVLELEGLGARDWEDVAINVENDIPYIYVAEIGDNRGQYQDKYIYRFPEPSLDGDEIKIVISDIDTIQFAYPVKARDAESLMVDPITKDIVIISKREKFSKIFELKYPYSKEEINVLVEIGELPFRNTVAGDISPDGQKVLVKTYDEVFFWRRQNGESIAELLTKASVRVPYQREPQGEAIAWSREGDAFYTLSEERNGVPARFYEYKKNLESCQELNNQC